MKINILIEECQIELAKDKCFAKRFLYNVSASVSCIDLLSCFCFPTCNAIPWSNDNAAGYLESCHSGDLV